MRIPVGPRKPRALAISATVTLLVLGILGATGRDTSGAVAALTFAPQADTYVRSDQPTRALGSATRIALDASPTKHILLRFSVSGVGAGTVASAKLRLYNLDGSSVGGTFYRAADNSWGETTVTWDTAPPADATPLASIGAVAANTW